MYESERTSRSFSRKFEHEFDPYWGHPRFIFFVGCCDIRCGRVCSYIQWTCWRRLFPRAECYKFSSKEPIFGF